MVDRSANTSDAAAQVLDVLHDPTRRRVLELLRGGEHSVRELTDSTTVSQPAVSQHLKVLREAGLVVARPEGARRLYRIDPNGFSVLRVWVDSFWDETLASFVAHAERAPLQDGATEANSSNRKPNRGESK